MFISITYVQYRGVIAVGEHCQIEGPEGRTLAGWPKNAPGSPQSRSCGAVKGRVHYGVERHNSQLVIDLILCVRVVGDSLNRQQTVSNDWRILERSCQFGDFSNWRLICGIIQDSDMDGRA